MNLLVHYVTTGRTLILRMDGTTVVLPKAYSGSGEHINRVASQARVSSGPIPCGVWDIGIPFDSTKTGPYVLPLKPETYYGPRSGFQIHGDNAKGDRSASSGCIVLPRDARECITAERCKTLLVVP